MFSGHIDNRPPHAARPVRPLLRQVVAKHTLRLDGFPEIYTLTLPEIYMIVRHHFITNYIERGQQVNERLQRLEAEVIVLKNKVERIPTIVTRSNSNS